MHLRATSVSSRWTAQAGTDHVQRDHEPNVARIERQASIVGGAMLLLYGIFRADLRGVGLVFAGAGLIHRGVTGRCRIYHALGIGTAPPRSPVASVPHHQGVKVEHSVTIGRPAAELYGFWRQLENLPLFMEHLDSVTVRDDGTSHWVAKARLGKRVEWDAAIHNERPNQLLAWRSLPGSDVDHAGSVQFHEAPGGRGTEMKVVLEYHPPAGRVGETLAKLLGEEPERQVREDLRRFKQVMEAGEIPTIEGQPAARSAQAGARRGPA
jgi:uncharacterized membrane protein